MKQKLLTRFLQYINIDTQSNPSSDNTPSTKKQFDLAKVLVKELKELGLKDAHMDDKCYIMATLPPNIDKDVPVIGFLAHIDTSPDMSGKDIKPRIIENYDGQDILLNQQNNLYLKVNDFPELKKYIRQTLITTDGTTLLGADDKAGIAEIITAVEYLVNNPEIKHGTIKIGFTPDEEIGKGVDHFDVNKFGADYAYTIDGGEVGEIDYENFNAAFAKIRVQGRNVHPGMAKNKMINSMLVGSEFNDMLPVFDRPEFTDDYEGFFHLIKFDGTVEESTMQYIIRDHNRDLFENRKKMIYYVADFINKKYGEGTITIEMKDQYYNMREKVEPVYHIVEIAEKAMKELDIKPIIKPIRGGTDGSRLSYMGLPCPNIFAGGHNFHGKYEFIPLESMEKATRVILKIIELYANK
ncbi:MAG: peptidase T [Bacteroidetes bacterium]|nr:MAG: peptidase T [Bacteroidota bacterium]